MKFVKGDTIAGIIITVLAAFAISGFSGLPWFIVFLIER
jgi:type III secretory pathway component EscV